MANYPKPGLTGDAVVLAGYGQQMSLLVVQRGKPPFEGLHALPGGFADPGETTLTTTLRELQEETALQLSPNLAIELSFRAVAGRDPRGWTVTVPYLFHLDQPMPVKAGDDAAAASFVPLTELGPLAFDHGAILCEALGRFWPLMPTHNPRLQGPAWGMPQQDTWPHTWFYGGSFNPWHSGHDACVDQCPQNTKHLIVVPDRNPNKQLQKRHCYWAAYKALCGQLKDRVAGLFPGYFGLESPTPTIQWLPHTQTANRRLVMGADSFAGFPGWYRAKILIKSIDQIMVVPRTGFDRDQLQKAEAWATAHNPKVAIAYAEAHPHEHLSSTAIRAQNQPK